MGFSEQYIDQIKNGNKQLLFRDDEKDISILIDYWIKEGCEGILNISEYHKNDSLPSVKNSYTVSFFVSISEKSFRWQCQVNYSNNETRNAKTFFFGNRKLKRSFIPKGVVIEIFKKLY